MDDAVLFALLHDIARATRQWHEGTVFLDGPASREQEETDKRLGIK